MSAEPQCTPDDYLVTADGLVPKSEIMPFRQKELERYAPWLASITFPKTTFRLDVNRYSSDAACELELVVECEPREQATGEPPVMRLEAGDVFKVRVSGLPVPAGLDRAGFLDVIRASIHAWMLHEADELILVDGVRLYDPHQIGWRAPKGYMVIN